MYLAAKSGAQKFNRFCGQKAIFIHLLSTFYHVYLCLFTTKSGDVAGSAIRPVPGRDADKKPGEKADKVENVAWKVAVLAKCEI